MPTKNTGKPNGRTIKPIDWDKVDELLIAGCLGTEIAACFGIHHNTFYDKVYQKYGVTFSEYQQQKASVGDSMLRKTQFDVAQDKDKTMLIWLGKQRLKQREPEAAIQLTTVSAAEKFIELMESNVKEPNPES